MQLLLSNTLVFKPTLLVELGHAIMTKAAVELQAVWSAVILGEVTRALLPGVAPLAVLPQVVWTRCPWLCFDPCTEQACDM